MKKVLILTAALLMLGSLAMVQAQGVEKQVEYKVIKETAGFGRGHGGHGGGGQCSILDCKDKLNLTDDQMTKLKALKFKHQNQMIDLRADLQKARLNMRNEHSAEMTKSKALSLNKEINRIEAAKSAAQIGHKFDVKDVLTKEQFEIWHQCQSGCGSKGSFGGRGGHGGKGCDSQCGPGGKGGFGGHGSKACDSKCGSGCKSGHGKFNASCDKHGSGGYGSGKACDKHGFGGKGKGPR